MNIKLMQNYFIVENPMWIGKKTQAGLHIPETARNNKNEEDLKKEFDKMTRLKVLSTGDSCTKIKVSDEVCINTNLLLSNGGIKVEIEDKGYLIFREADIVFIY